MDAALYDVMQSFCQLYWTAMAKYIDKKAATDQGRIKPDFFVQANRVFCF